MPKNLSKLLGYSFLYSANSFHRGLLAKWYLEFCEDSKFTGFTLLCGFPPSLLLPSSLWPVPLQRALASKKVMGATIFILLMWKWAKRSTQLAVLPSMLTWVPFVALLLDIYTLYFTLNCLWVWHATGVDGTACSVQLSHIHLYLGCDYLLTATLHLANVKWL